VAVIDRRRKPGRTEKPQISFDVWPNAVKKPAAPPPIRPGPVRKMPDLHQLVPPAPLRNPSGTRQGADRAGGPPASTPRVDNSVEPKKPSVSPFAAAALIQDGQIVTKDPKHQVRRVGLIGNVVIWRCNCGLSLGQLADDKGTRLYWLQTKGILALPMAADVTRALQTDCWHPRHQARKANAIATQRAAKAAKESGQSAMT
jgi:hypothetical protein